MAINTTQKDRTLNEIIEWAQSRKRETPLTSSDNAYDSGRNDVLDELIQYCRGNLGMSAGRMSPDSPDKRPGRTPSGEPAQNRSHASDQPPTVSVSETSLRLPFLPSSGPAILLIPSTDARSRRHEIECRPVGRFA